MKRIEIDELSSRIDDIYSFLELYDSKWLKAYFIDKDDFLEFLDDEDIRVLAYTNDSGELSCVGILDENSILTVGFLTGEGKEENFETFLDDSEALLTKLHYTSIYFGNGTYSFGVYDKDGSNELDDFLEKKGFVVEAVSYDIRHSVGSINNNNEPKKYAVYKFSYETFRDAEEQKNPDPSFRDITLDFYKYPSDVCYIGVQKGESEIQGFAFLNPREYVIDSIYVKSKSPLEYRDVKNELLSNIATDLSVNGVSSFVEPNVDQIESQKLSNEFEVCGKYKTMSKGIK